MPPSTSDPRVRVAAGAAVIDLAGDLDGGARDHVEAAYDDAARTGLDRVVLGFTAVDYINSSGIALIVRLLRRARADGRDVAAYGLSDHYREIFAITRLSDFVRLADDEASAVADPATAAS